MNNLSWILYAADLAGTLKHVVPFVFFFFLPVAAFFILMSDDREDYIQLLKKRAKGILIIMSCAWTIWMLTPSSKTIYMIAASEMGEEAIKTEVAQKLFKVINDKLDEQLGSKYGE